MRDTLDKQKRIVIVVPCYNEEASLPHTIVALEAARQQLLKKYSVDFLFVNDGSSDTTQQQLIDIGLKNSYIYYREFSKNVGHQSALRAGINASVGYDAAIMMDADLQHPPELLPDMLAAWEKGAKIVQMVRHDSHKQTGVLRYWVGVFYYKFINWLSDLKLEYGASDFRLIDKSVTSIITNSPESNLFLRGYFSWIPVARTNISYKPNQRVAGTSKYTLKKMLDLAYKSILQFSEKPLRLAVGLGVVLASLSFAYGAILTVLHFTGTHAVSGWTSLMVAMLFFFGVNFVLLGIIGTYLAHAIDIQKQRPEFVIASEKLPGEL